MLDEDNIPHPTIITESGRATVAYYSILVFNILETIHFEAPKVPTTIPETSHEMLHNLIYVYNTMTLKNIQECYNDALYYKDEIHQLFQMGQINLRQRATADIIFWNIIQQIAINARKLKRLPQELINIESAIADIYYGNFSLFQSLPDSWAIEHLFPIMPIHRLETAPTRNAIFGDITCDSDGKIERFIDQHDVRHALPVHEVKKTDEYYIGAFLVGAYQETLGDLHNLLGDTNIVNIRINSDSTFDFVKELEGDTISEVLSYVEYDIRTLRDQFRAKAERAVKDRIISVKERREILAAYENGLRGYTYFER
jgi:arginine decarboxylase